MGAGRALDEEQVRTLAQLKARFEQICPVELTRPIEKILTELDESFIRVPAQGDYAHPWERRKLDWFTLAIVTS